MLKPRPRNQQNQLKLIKEKHGTIELALILQEETLIKLLPNKQQLKLQMLQQTLKMLPLLLQQLLNQLMKTQETEKVLKQTTGMNTGSPRLFLNQFGTMLPMTMLLEHQPRMIRKLLRLTKMIQNHLLIKKRKRKMRRKTRRQRH